MRMEWRKESRTGLLKAAAFKEKKKVSIYAEKWKKIRWGVIS
jgi:hypothetical protein